MFTNHSGSSNKTPVSILKNSCSTSVEKDSNSILNTPILDRKQHTNSPITPHRHRDLPKSPRKLNNLKQTELVW